ncbi:MAG: hypothetical protein CMF69_00705 [Magnetovibrio sp.]|nr:hypothetical protein [Magnetovibrio sp.]
MISKLFYKIAKFAVGELVKNPELQAKTANFLKERVVPGVKSGWKKAKPKREQAKGAAVSAKENLAEVARDNHPLENPNKFLSEASQKLRDQAKR